MDEQLRVAAHLREAVLWVAELLSRERPVTETLIGSIESLAAYAPVWGFFLIFFFMTVESSFIPFPSEVVMIPAGFLAARGGLTFGSPLLDAGAGRPRGHGGLAGGRVRQLLPGAGRGEAVPGSLREVLLPAAAGAAPRAEELFRQYGAGATFVCRLLPAIRQLISIPAGLARMPLGASRSGPAWAPASGS